jgi:hypothetical protein
MLHAAWHPRRVGLPANDPSASLRLFTHHAAAADLPDRAFFHETGRKQVQWWSPFLIVPSSAVSRSAPLDIQLCQSFVQCSTAIDRRFLSSRQPRRVLAPIKQKVARANRNRRSIPSEERSSSQWADCCDFAIFPRCAPASAAGVPPVSVHGYNRPIDRRLNGSPNAAGLPGWT